MVKGRCTGKRWLVSTRSWLGPPPCWSCSFFCGDTVLTSRAGPVRGAMCNSLPPPHLWSPGPTYLHAADEAGADALLQPSSWGVSPEDLHNLETTAETMNRGGLGTSRHSWVWHGPHPSASLAHPGRPRSPRMSAQQAASPNQHLLGRQHRAQTAESSSILLRHLLHLQQLGSLDQGLQHLTGPALLQPLCPQPLLQLADVVPAGETGSG